MQDRRAGFEGWRRENDRRSGFGKPESQLAQEMGKEIQGEANHIRGAAFDPIDEKGCRALERIGPRLVTVLVGVQVTLDRRRRKGMKPYLGLRDPCGPLILRQ